MSWAPWPLSSIWLTAILIDCDAICCMSRVQQYITLSSVCYGTSVYCLFFIFLRNDRKIMFCKSGQTRSWDYEALTIRWGWVCPTSQLLRAHPPMWAAGPPAFVAACVSACGEFIHSVRFRVGCCIWSVCCWNSRRRWSREGIVGCELDWVVRFFLFAYIILGKWIYSLKSLGQLITY